MNTSTSRPSIKSIEHEGFFYVVTDTGIYAKGCSRCGGTGHYSFNGIDSICYLCHNIWEARLGDVFENEAQAQKWCHGKAMAKARRDAKREEERLAKLAKRDAAWQALKDEHPAVWELLSSIAGVSVPFTDSMYDQARPERNSFVLAMVDKLWTLDERPLTANMIAALEREASKRAGQQAEAAAHPAPAGRAVVTGEVVGTKVVEGDYGTSYKVTVKDDQGFKVWCSLPKAQADEIAGNGNFDPEYEWFHAAKGRRITFTATLEPSQDDVSFAFGSRPTKGSWL